MIGLLLLVVAGSTSWFLLAGCPVLLYRGGPFPMGNGAF